MTRDTGPNRATRALVLARDKGQCVRCGGTDLLQAHHRRPRGMGGSRLLDTNAASSLLTLCLQCHGWVESRRASSLADGYLVRQGQDPSTVPVRWHGEWVLLEADGTVRAARRSA